MGYDFYPKVPFGNDLGSHAKPLLFMLKASHEQPHGNGTVVNKREYDFTYREDRGKEGVFIEPHLEEYSCNCISHMASFFL